MWCSADDVRKLDNLCAMLLLLCSNVGLRVLMLLLFDQFIMTPPDLSLFKWCHK